MANIRNRHFRGFIKPGTVCEALFKPIFSDGTLYLIEITEYYDDYGSIIGCEAVVIDELTGMSKMVDLPIAYINDLFIEASSPAAQVLFGKK